MNAIVTDFTARHTKAELTDIFGGKIPFGPVMRADEIFADPHFAARGMLADVEVPGASRPLTVAGTPVHMSATPGGVRRRAPLTGEDTDADPRRVRPGRGRGRSVEGARDRRLALGTLTRAGAGGSGFTMKQGGVACLTKPAVAD